MGGQASTFQNLYKKGMLLGKGSFGEVRLCRCKSDG
jgi:hypothetical protein